MNLHRDNWFTWVIISFILCLLLVGLIPIAEISDTGLQFTDYVSESEEKSVFLASTPHAPIIINGDANFSDTALAEGWAGNGSSGNPFMIVDLDIDLGGSAGHCISISNTMVNFTISNCNLTGASVGSGAGVYLDNVMNARVVDTICQLNTHGVLIQGRGSRNCILINNTCTQNSVSGIQIVASLNISLIRNNCNSNYHGINAIDIMGLGGHSGEHVIASNFCDNNTYGISFGEINVESIGPILNTIINNNCSANSEDGIRLINTGYSTLTNNSCNGNGASGIRLRIDDSQNILVENICNENGQSGMYLDNSVWENNITDNLCSMNDQYGIYLYMSAGFNNINWNGFRDNLVSNVRDEGLENIFDYNYWSDYSGVDSTGDGFGDSPYPIVSGNQDLHPLMRLPGSPPLWIETPTNQETIHTDSFRYDLNISAYKYVDLWWLNDTVNFHINQSGVITNTTILQLGRFGLHVFANDTYGNIISAIFTIAAMELFPPTWIQQPEDKMIEYGYGLSYKLNATDISGLDSWWLNDTTHFNLNDIGLVTTIGIIPVGFYGLQVFVNDTWGNTLNGTFVVTVTDTISPSFVIFYSFEYAEEIVIQVIFEDLSGIDHYWLNDTSYFSVDDNGVIRNAVTLNPGVYRLEVRAYDLYDNICSATLVVTVLEAPLITTTTTTTTSTTSNTTPDVINPVITLVLGAGIGGAAVVVIVIVFVRRKS